MCFSLVNTSSHVVSRKGVTMKTTKLSLEKTMPLFPGLTAQIFTGEQLMGMRVMAEAGACAPAHSHPHEQMSIVVQGEIEFTVGDEKKLLKAGDFLSIPGNVVHSAVAQTDTELYEFFTPMREDLIERYAL
jgi:quercetin dioxygenase-like cupin family protein